MATVLRDGSYLLSKEEYFELRDRDNILSALESAGVDNWCGWGEHWEYYDSSFDPDYCDED